MPAEWPSLAEAVQELTRDSSSCNEAEKELIRLIANGQRAAEGQPNEGEPCYEAILDAWWSRPIIHNPGVLETGPEGSVLVDFTASTVRQGGRLSFFMKSYKHVRVSPNIHIEQGHGKVINPNKGGRPPKYDWDEFWCEVINIANTPDGLPERSKLQRIMLNWCAERWGTEPSESVIRDKLAKVHY